MNTPVSKTSFLKTYRKNSESRFYNTNINQSFRLQERHKDLTDSMEKMKLGSGAPTPQEKRKLSSMIPRPKGPGYSKTFQNKSDVNKMLIVHSQPSSENRKEKKIINTAQPLYPKMGMGSTDVK